LIGFFLHLVKILALDLKDYQPSVLLHCWFGHLTCKIVSEMTYNVSSGTLNPTMPYHFQHNVCQPAISPRLVCNLNLLLSKSLPFLHSLLSY